MKKCSYCGKEYPDNEVRCLFDNEPLSGGEGQPLAVAGEIAVATASSADFVAVSGSPALAAPLAEHQLLTLEVVLVCLIAFGGSILTSFHEFFGYESGSSSTGAFKWIYAIVRQGSVLGLLWYVLKRRQKSFADLGLVWAPKDVGWSIALWAAGSAAFRAVYDAIYLLGLTAVSHKAATAHIGHYLFGANVSMWAIAFQFLNPFFEELIVRAYVMTEIKQLTGSATKAIIVSTVLQTSYHFYQGAPAAFGHGATFLIWSIYYAKIGRITPVVLAHLYSDVGATLWYLFHP